MENQYMQSVKWLRVLMYTMIVSIANSLLSYLPFMPALLTTWVRRGVSVAMVLWMFQLASVNARYRKAGILHLVALVSTFFALIPVVGPVLVLAASILTVIAVYQEYHAHGEVITDKDSVLAEKWNRLFVWELIADVLIAVVSAVVTVVLMMLQLDAVQVTAVITGILQLVGLVINVIYITYIKKMTALLSDGE